MIQSDDSLDSKLREKLENGEINQTEYDELYQKFNKLGLIGDSKKEKPPFNLLIKGIRSIEGAEFGFVMCSGELNVDGSLECQRLSISGSVTVEGNIRVISNSNVNGQLLVSGKAEFGGPLSSSGFISIDGDLLTVDKFSVSGKLIVDGDIVSNRSLNISGELHSRNIRCSSSVRLSGNALIDNDIIAETLEISQGNIQINNIKAKKIYITDPIKHMKIDLEKEIGDIDGLPEIAKFATSIATNILPSIGTLLTSITQIFDPHSTSKITILGNIEGEEIIISNTHIRGDIIGDTVILGQEVKVEGMIYYRNKINTQHPLKYRITRIDSEDE